MPENEPKTELGKKVEKATSGARNGFADDLGKLTKTPFDALQAVADKIAKTHPACVPYQIVAIEAEQRGIEHRDLYDAISAFIYVWANMDDDSPQDVIADLASLDMIDNGAARVLAALLASAAPFRQTARTASLYIRVGAPLFANIQGVVDVRLRFHETAEEFENGYAPKGVQGTQHVILANLTLRDPSETDRVVPFLMDENDLQYMKRFVKHMEKELEFSRELFKSSEIETNG